MVRLSKFRVAILMGVLAFPSYGSPGGSLIGKPPQANDLQEFESEIDRDLDGEELPQRRSVQKPMMETPMLERSLFEKRRAFRYRLGFGLGEAQPWQNFAVHLLVPFEDAPPQTDDPSDAVVTPVDSQLFWVWGASIGGGTFADQGRADQRPFDLDYAAQSFVLLSRVFWAKFPRWSFGTTLGYAFWDGDVKVLGADDTEADTDRLTSGFQGSGLFGTVHLTVGWEWDWNGRLLVLEWTPVGFSRSQITRLDQGREHPLMRLALENHLKKTAIFGITNLSLSLWM